MSNKLKIMQEPLVRQPMPNESVNQPEAEGLFYKVETCSMHTYYIEVIEWQGSLFEAIQRLLSDFNVDASRYCDDCKSPAIQKIAVVSSREVPVADAAKLVFVSRLQ